MAGNLVDIKTHHQDFKDKTLGFSVSSRYLRPDIDIFHYLKMFYMPCNSDRIESVFGHSTTYSRLYGGRPFKLEYALTDAHIRNMESKGIHIALTLTNHFFDNLVYKESQCLLKRFHKPGNSIICTNDEFAGRVKNDFPDYEIKASLIKNINTIEKVEKALEVYDTLTIPMEMNDDDRFLERISPKNRMILFGNAGCAYNCPSRTCYMGISRKIFNRSSNFAGGGKCSKAKIPREDKGIVWFDVKKFSKMGFKRFKLIPAAPQGIRELARRFSSKQNYFFNSLAGKKQVYYFCSFPKCGRTWVRFLIAHYLKLKEKIDIDIDLHSIFTLLPNDGNDDLKGTGRYGFSDHPRIPLILFSHTAYKKEKFLNQPVIFMLRSVFDVVVSDYFHQSRLLRQYKGDLRNFIRDANGGLNRYIKYLNSWSAFLLSSRSCIFTYEMLHENTKGTISGLFEHLNFEIHDTCVNESIRQASFKTMQTVERERGIAGHPNQSMDKQAQRVRKGVVGGYKNYLDESDLRYIKDTCRSRFTPETTELLDQVKLLPEI